MGAGDYLQPLPTHPSPAAESVQIEDYNRLVKLFNGDAGTVGAKFGQALSAGLNLVAGGTGIDTIAAGTLNVGTATATGFVLGGGHITSGLAVILAVGSANPWGLVLRRTDLGSSSDVKMFNTGTGLYVNSPIQASSLDHTAAATLAIGGTTATGVSVGRAGQSVGFYGHAVVAQPAAPVTLADVIAIIRGCGLSA